MRIGILGGTFDPPHVGHLELARAAREGLDLDEVLFIPARRNPLKGRQPGASARHRLAMVKLLVAEEPCCAVSDIEINQSGPSYTIDTLQTLMLMRPAEYWLILGADAAADLREWKSYQKILKLARLAVAVRRPLGPSDVLLRLPAEAHPFVHFIEMAPQAANATAIREELSRGIEPSQWLTEPVLHYIREHALYGDR